MIKIIFRNILRFIVLVLLQVWVLNNIQLSGYINPYMYVLFILLLPFETPKWLILILAFSLGLAVDMFSNTPGIHASASVFMAFFRPFVLQSISPRDGFETGTFPRVHYYGIKWFFKYTLLLVFLHHLFLFTVEVFNFHNFHLTLWRTVLSTLFSTLLILISQLIIFRK